MTRMARLSRVLVTLTCVLVASACGFVGGDEEEPDMTPQQAADQMRDLAEEVLNAASPDGTSSFGDPVPEIPCGGPNGTDFTKIKASLTGLAGAKVNDGDAAFGAAREVLERRGATVEPVREIGGGKILGFDDDVVAGSLVLHPDGRLVLDAGTECLDNPELD